MIKELKLNRKTLGPSESGPGVFFYGVTGKGRSSAILEWMRQKGAKAGVVQIQIRATTPLRPAFDEAALLRQRKRSGR